MAKGLRGAHGPSVARAIEYRLPSPISLPTSDIHRYDRWKARPRCGESRAAHRSASHASKRCRASASATPLSTWDCVIPVLTTSTGTILPMSATADALLNSLECCCEANIKALCVGETTRGMEQQSPAGASFGFAEGDDSQLGEEGRECWALPWRDELMELSHSPRTSGTPLRLRTRIDQHLHTTTPRSFRLARSRHSCGL